MDRWMDLQMDMEMMMKMEATAPPKQQIQSPIDGQGAYDDINCGAAGWRRSAEPPRLRRMTAAAGQMETVEMKAIWMTSIGDGNPKSAKAIQNIKVLQSQVCKFIRYVVTSN